MLDEPSPRPHPYLWCTVTAKDVKVMLRADELTVVHHDDTVSRFTDVSYLLSSEGLRVLTAGGRERLIPRHDVLTTFARRSSAA
jgi:hypothetical protein